VALSVLVSLQIIPLLTTHRPRTIPWLVLGLWAALATLIFIGMAYAPDQELAESRTINWIALVAVPLGIGALRVGSEPRAVRHLLWVIFLIGTVSVLSGLLQLSSEQRLTALNTDTIAAGRAALLVPILAVTFVLPRGVLLMQVVTVALIPASLIVSVASGSRGPLLVLFVLAVVWGLRWLTRASGPGRRSIWIPVAVVIASIGLISVVAANVPGESIDRYTSLGSFVEGALAGDVNPSAGDVSAGTRLTLYQGAWAMFEDNPLIGAGTAGFAATSARYVGASDADLYPHNALLQFAAEYGVLGIALFGILVVLALIRALPSGDPTAIRALFVFALLNAMVSGNIFDDRTLWGLLLLVLLVDATPELWARIASRPAAVSVRSTIIEPRPMFEPGPTAQPAD